VTCATELFKIDADEQLIYLQTCHRSDAVRAYKQLSDAHFHRISEILQPPPPELLNVGDGNAFQLKKSRCRSSWESALPWLLYAGSCWNMSVHFMGTSTLVLRSESTVF